MMQQKIIKNSYIDTAKKLGYGIGLLLLLTSCSAIVSTIENHSLKSKNQLSTTIFLDIDRKKPNRVFIWIRNASGKTDFNALSNDVTKSLQQKGYKIVDSADNADLILQVNIRYFGEVSKETKIEQLLKDDAPIESLSNNNTANTNSKKIPNFSEYDFSGVFIGGAIGFFTSSGGALPIIGAAVAGGFTSVITQQMFANITYIAITDIDIGERSNKKLIFTDKRKFKQDDNSTRSMDFYDETNWRHYRTRMITTANRASLSEQKASKTIEEKIKQALSGLL